MELKEVKYSGSGLTTGPQTGFQSIKKTFFRERHLWFLVLPGILYYLIFCYIPMYGFVIAFEDFSPFKGILGGPWVGFMWFQDFFKSIFFWRLIRNTLLLNIYHIIFGFPAPIILALLFNEITHTGFKRVAQTISYLPHFISTVVIVGFVVNFLSPSTGIINQVIKALGMETVNFMILPQWFRTIYVASGIWQEVGWGSIIYLAALSNIDQELYEAATMDGAGKLRQMWNITLPCLLPTIIILLILNMGHMLSIGYEKILLMYNTANYETADVINTYVYRRGIIDGQLSFGAAVGLFQSVINFILIIFTNRISKKVSEVSLW